MKTEMGSQNPNSQPFVGVGKSTTYAQGGTSTSTAKDGKPSAASNVFPLLHLSNEVQHHIYQYLKYRDILNLGNTCPHLKNIIRNGGLDAISWFNQFPQQTRKTWEKVAGDLKHENGLDTLLKRLTNNQSVIDSLKDKKESTHFAAQLFYTLSQLMMDCESFAIQEKASIQHDDKVRFASFSADGRYVVTASDDKKVKIYEMDTEGKWIEKASIQHDGQFNSASFSADGLHVVTATDRTVKLYKRDTEGTWTEKASIGDGSWVRSASLSADGSHIMITNGYNMVNIYGMNEKGEWIEKISIDQPNCTINSASFSQDGRQVVTASQDGTVKIHEMNEEGEWAEKASISHEQSAMSAYLSPDGHHVVTNALDQATLYGVDKEGKCTEKVSLKLKNGWIHSVNFSPDGNHMVITHQNMAQLYEVNQKGEWVKKTSIKHDCHIKSASFSADGSHLVLLAANSNTAALYGVDKKGEWTTKISLEHANTYNPIGFNADGSHLVTVSADGTATIHGINKKGKWVEKAYIQHDHRIKSASLSADGRHVVTVSDDNTVRISIINKSDDNAPLLCKKQRLSSCSIS